MNAKKVKIKEEALKNEEITVDDFSFLLKEIKSKKRNEKCKKITKK